MVCEAVGSDHAEIVPWGWSRYTRTLLGEAGISPESVYDDESLERIRTLSHRSISVKVNSMIEAQGVSIPPVPVKTGSMDEVMTLSRDYARRGYRGVVVKLPWSCSSRGVVMGDCDRIAALTSQIEGMIRRQGSVMVEPWLERTADFALLFESDGEGRVAYRAASTFVTDSAGRYGGNVVAQQSVIAEMVGTLPGGLIQAAETALSRTIGRDYRGWLGVDMMRYTYEGDERIAPCVEVNLRMTMGVAAYLTAARMYADGLLREGERRLLNVTPAGINLTKIP